MSVPIVPIPAMIIPMMEPVFRPEPPPLSELEDEFGEDSDVRVEVDGDAPSAVCVLGAVGKSTHVKSR